MPSESNSKSICIHKHFPAGCGTRQIYNHWSEFNNVLFFKVSGEYCEGHHGHI